MKIKTMNFFKLLIAILIITFFQKSYSSDSLNVTKISYNGGYGLKFDYYLIMSAPTNYDSIEIKIGTKKDYNEFLNLGLKINNSRNCMNSSIIINNNEYCFIFHCDTILNQIIKSQKISFIIPFDNFVSERVVSFSIWIRGKVGYSNKYFYFTPFNDTLVAKIDGVINDTVYLPTIDTCLLDYSQKIDSFYIKNHTIQNNTLLLNWVIEQSGKIYNITSKISKDQMQTGNILLYLTITCNVKKGLHSTTFVAPYNLTTTVLEESMNNSGMKIYPNPFINNTTLTLPTNENYALIISDMQGRQVKQYRGLTGEKATITSEGMQTGLYFYTLTNQTNGHLYNGKFIITK